MKVYTNYRAWINTFGNIGSVLILNKINGILGKNDDLLINKIQILSAKNESTKVGPD